jgi:hypothetical protein
MFGQFVLWLPCPISTFAVDVQLAAVRANGDLCRYLKIENKKRSAGEVSVLMIIDSLVVQKAKDPNRIYSSWRTHLSSLR